MTPDEIAARVWPGRTASIEPLGGGITNRNHLVEVDGERFVVRVSGKDTSLLGIDRNAEHEASRVAAALGVGPEVVAFVEPEGYLVTRYVDGRPASVDEMRRPGSVRSVARTLRHVHDGPPVTGRFDAVRVVQAYSSTAADRGVPVPAEYGEALEVARAIERARGPQPLRPCHNDLLSANFIDDGVRLWIVDWEYAGMGDVFFDLANFSVNNELSSEQNRILLEAYFGKVRDRDLAALELMRFLSDFREAMWGVVQQGLSELDFDFAGYAAEHFRRLERTASDPAFASALEAAA
jgi:thiamine kinase-like enzyme